MFLPFALIIPTVIFHGYFLYESRLLQNTNIDWQYIPTPRYSSTGHKPEYLRCFVILNISCRRYGFGYKYIQQVESGFVIDYFRVVFIPYLTMSNQAKQSYCFCGKWYSFSGLTGKLFTYLSQVGKLLKYMSTPIRWFLAAYKSR